MLSSNTSASNKYSSNWSPRQPQTQPSRARHPDFQSAFYRNPSRSRRQVSALPLVPSPRTNRTHIKSTPPIQGSSKNIHICPRPRPPQLHEEAICPSRLHNRSPRQTGQPTNLGHEIGCRFQPWHVDGTPPMFSSVCHKNQSNKNKSQYISSTSTSPTQQSHLNPTLLQQHSNSQRHSKAISGQETRRQRH